MNRLAADLVVDELWNDPPAPISYGCQDGWCFSNLRDGRLVLMMDAEASWDDCVVVAPVDEVELRLDDPLGLGLAGLAARVHQRCGADDLPTEICRVIDLTPGCNHPRHLGLHRTVEVSIYFALTDRVCKAEGLTLKPGEAATLEREAGGWCLRCSDPAGKVWLFPPTDSDDWQAVLEAHLDVTDGQ